MAESSSHPSESASASQSGQDDAPEEGTFKARLKRKKLFLVLSATALGGLLLGVGGMTLIAYLHASKEAHAPTAVATPEPDAKQEALTNELAELKAKNEKLEEQLSLSQSGTQATQVSSLVHDDASLPVVPPIRPAGAQSKEKVTADCTVPDQTEKLSEKLKSCIEGFNSSTH